MMKMKKMILRTLLAAALICGVIEAYPSVSSAIATSSESISTLQDRVYIKSQDVEYTTDKGETFVVFVSSNSDESIMKMYVNFFGNRESVLVQKNADNEYEAVDGSLFAEDAVKIAEMASKKSEWREM